MQPRRHPEILNTVQTTSEESRFTLFPLLPTELRFKIWYYELQRSRLIQVQLENVPGFSMPIVDDPPCSISVINGSHVSSKLLRVNYEARMIALKFYRVHFPCWLLERSIHEGRSALGTLYFNPEYDTLLISSRTTRTVALVEFLYHLKHTYDPRHVGLLNLGVDISTLKLSQSCFPTPTCVNSKIEKAFVETLIQLREVFFVSIVEAECNLVHFGDQPELYQCSPKRALPIMATVPTFERMNDPRSIGGDLQRVYTGTNPLAMLCIWLKLLRVWDVSPVQTRYQFMLALDPPIGQTPVYSQRSAKQWLHEEEKIEETSYGYEKYIDDILLEFSETGNATQSNPEEGFEKATRPAFGFWIFPIEAFGKLPEKALLEDVRFQRSREDLFVDLSRHVPEIGLFDLPES